MKFAYWAKTKDNKQVNFISNNFMKIGEKAQYKGQNVTITDFAVEYPNEQKIDKAELRIEGRIIL